ncbi:cupin domain-containing protein [Simiduia curdlanivorans]|uniref:Cupin domain-containing protein n=1 Tax=Simiduia curdlanivorans TaxID=1492769 RepID=A0ABV8V359_9GAMM|nr:cupin domain-containing protein [Simiduia curdlanivorans]MDN3638351.1 cupin domain-containing protein [Simiduia curdlanivorans]
MKNFFTELPNAKHEEIFQTLLAQPNLKIERIISNGQSSPADHWYDQEQAEWIMLIQGEAGIEFKGEQAIALKPGDYLNIPAHQQHRVAWTKKDATTLWLAIHYTAT